MKTLKYLPILLFLTCTAWAGVTVGDTLYNTSHDIKIEIFPSKDTTYYNLIIDTTLCDSLLMGHEFDNVWGREISYYWKKIYCIDTTWAEDTTQVDTYPGVSWFDLVKPATSDTASPPKDPLKFKVDTVRVDTVDWKIEYDYLPVPYNQEELMRGYIVDTAREYREIPRLVPILSYTIDTTYYLTPEQIRKLEGR